MSKSAIRTDEARKRVFKLYTFDAKTKEISGVTTCSTREMTDKEFKACLARERSKPFYKNAIWEIVK
jgi:hypothetical protein